METLFFISAVGIAAMIAVRLIEMRYERMFGLSHASVFIEKKLRPHVKKLSKTTADKKAALAQKMQDIPRHARRLAFNAGHVAEKYAIEMQNMLRGKRALQKGSVSFFLLNIADIPVEKEKRRIDDVMVRRTDEASGGSIENTN